MSTISFYVEIHTRQYVFPSVSISPPLLLLFIKQVPKNRIFNFFKENYSRVYRVTGYTTQLKLLEKLIERASTFTSDGPKQAR